jgi:ADP-heptose:LPS heptosyltransferase
MFCRNQPEVKLALKNHPLIHQVWTHSEMRDAWKHLKFLRRQKFDGVIVFFTGDPSFTKMKYFAFLVGARHKIIFNEHFNCFFFAPGRWFSFLAHRFGEHWLERKSPAWHYHGRLLLFLSLKVVLLPFRFAWLLLVWLRLRGAVLLTENKYDDCPL